MRSRLLILAGALSLATACVTTKTKLVWEPTSSTAQTEGGLTAVYVEHDGDRLPPGFFGEAPRCNAAGQVLVSGTGETYPTKKFILPQGWIILQLDFHNETDHVLRPERAVVRLSDPGSNDYRPVSKEDWLGELRSDPCLAGLDSAARRINVLDANTEILPGRKTSTYLVFAPDDAWASGPWTLSLYDMVVDTEVSGEVSEKTRFVWRFDSVTYKNTYKSGELVSSERIGGQ